MSWGNWREAGDILREEAETGHAAPAAAPSQARFVEFSEARNPKAIQRAIRHHLKALRRLGYQIPPQPVALEPTEG